MGAWKKLQVTAICLTALGIAASTSAAQESRKTVWQPAKPMSITSAGSPTSNPELLALLEPSAGIETTPDSTHRVFCRHLDYERIDALDRYGKPTGFYFYVKNCVEE